MYYRAVRILGGIFFKKKYIAKKEQIDKQTKKLETIFDNLTICEHTSR